MAAPVATGITVAEFEALPDDGNVYELIGGELYVKGAPLGRHGEAQLRAGAAVLPYCRATGATAFTNPGNVPSEVDAVIPDVALVAAEHVAGLNPAHIDRAADLIIEVSSPGTRRLDLGPKRDLYERVGVPEYWFVDLDADEILVFRRGPTGFGAPLRHGPGDVIRPPHLPGLEVAVNDILR